MNMRLTRVGVLGAVMSLTVVLGLSGAASASGSWHGVSGTVYSGCSGQGPWYISGIARTKSGSGNIKLQFSGINDGGITWKLLGQSNQQIGVTQSWSKNETGIIRTLATSVASGKVFYNTFRDTSYSCPDDQTNYAFIGSEFY